MFDHGDGPMMGYVKRRSDVWHRHRDCISGSMEMTEMTAREAQEKDCLPCPECCPEGWPTDTDRSAGDDDE